MQQAITDFFRDLDGVASVAELASFLDLDEGQVRSYARRHGLRRIGSTYAFSPMTALGLVHELELDEDDATEVFAANAPEEDDEDAEEEAPEDEEEEELEEGDGEEDDDDPEA